MNELSYPISYLERSDFDDKGNFVNAKSNPVFIMIQKARCPGCIAAKPNFQKLANMGIVQLATIQLDSPRPMEQRLSEVLNFIYPNISVVPSYVLYVQNQKIPYKGDGSLQGMINFIQQYI